MSSGKSLLRCQHQMRCILISWRCRFLELDNSCGHAAALLRQQFDGVTLFHRILVSLLVSKLNEICGFVADTFAMKTL